jgi:hypothetical protein
MRTNPADITSAAGIRAADDVACWREIAKERAAMQQAIDSIELPPHHVITSIERVGGDDWTGWAFTYRRMTWRERLSQWWRSR